MKSYLSERSHGLFIIVGTIAALAAGTVAIVKVASRLKRNTELSPE